MPTTSLFSIFNNPEIQESYGDQLGPALADSHLESTHGSLASSLQRGYSFYGSLSTAVDDSTENTKDRPLPSIEKADQTITISNNTVEEPNSTTVPQSLPQVPVDPWADYVIYGELDSKFLDTSQAAFAGRLHHMDILFPFELTTMDYLRRLFSCLVSGIKSPVISVSVSCKI
jgi:hypothetical protein